MLKKILLSMCVLLSCLCTSTFAQTGTFKANDVLRAEANEQSATAGNVSAGTKFDVLERKGFWVKLKAGNATGWAKLSALNLDQGSSGAGSAGSVLGGLASGRTGSGNIVSSAGTRGLSAEELKAAKPDMEAVAQVKRQAAAVPAATSYAQTAGLKDLSKPRSKGAIVISDDEIRQSLEGAQLKFQKERGTDVTIFSPRASISTLPLPRPDSAQCL